MDLGGKEDYIYCAADQICLAQECEASSKFELAFKKLQNKEINSSQFILFEIGNKK
jgi:hypothetical protein